MYKKNYIYLLLLILLSLFIFNSCSLLNFSKKDEVNINTSTKISSNEKTASKTALENEVKIIYTKDFNLNKINTDKKRVDDFFIYNNTLYFHDLDTLYIYSFKDQKMIFSKKFDSTIFTPFLIDYNNNLVFSNGTKLYVYDLLGKEIYSKDFFENIYSIASLPSGDLYLVTDVGTLYRFKNFNIIWRKKLNSTITSNLIISYDKKIYFGDGNGNIYCFDSLGNNLWIAKISGSAIGDFATDLSGNIYVISSNHILYSFDEKGNKLWSKEYNNVEKMFNVLIDNKNDIYMATNKNIVKYDKSGKELLNLEINGINSDILLVNNKILFSTDDKKLNILDISSKKIEKYNMSFNSEKFLFYDNKRLFFISSKGEIYYLEVGMPFDYLVWTYSRGFLNRRYLNLPPKNIEIVYPENDSTVVIDNSFTISWKAIDPNEDQLSFDIYYSQKNNDQMIPLIQNLKENKYEVNSLKGNSEYYIKIIANDGYFKTSSNIYKFKLYYRPQKAIAVYPSNNATNVEISLKLMWNSKDKDSKGISYNLYFGKDKKELKIIDKNIKNNYYNITQKLKPGEKYYWKIESIDSENNTNVSDIYEFTTSHAPATPILNLKDMEITYDSTISWESTDVDKDKLLYDIYLGESKDNIKLIKENYEKNYIVLSNNLKPGSEYYIKIVAKDDKGNYSKEGIYKLKTRFSPIITWKYKLDYKIEGSPVIDSKGNIIIGDNGGNLYKFNSKGLLIWKIKIGDKVWSNPTIRKDLVYVGNNNGYLYVINENGEIVWKFKTGDIISSSPTIDIDGTIYVGSWDGYLYAINPDGTLKWKFKTNNSISGSVVMGRDRTIYVGSWDGYLYAINPDGTLKWKFKTENRISRTPALSKDENIYIGSEDGYLYALTYEGKLKWKFKTENYIRSSPIIDSDNTVYVGSWDYYLYAINPDGTLKWKFKADYIVSSTPLVGNKKNIYFASYDHYVYCLNSKGYLEWKKDIKDIVNSNLLLTNNSLIFSDIDGTLYSMNVEDLNLDEFAQWPRFKKNNFNDGRLKVIKNSLPLGPGNPYPEDGQVDVSLYTTLSWQAYDMDGDTIYYDLYFGENPDKLNLISRDSTISIYKPEKLLKPKTTYYWKVVVTDSRNGKKEGKLWKFKTINPYGKIKWNFKTKGWIESVPLVVNDSIYFGSYDKYFYCLSLKGELKWKVPVESEIIGSANIDKNGNLYFGDNSGNVYSISKEGKLNWKNKVTYKIVSTPLVIDDKIYIGGYDGNLYALSSKDGKIEWKFKTGDYIAGIPAYYDKNIIFASGDSYVYSITQDGKLEWKIRTSSSIKSSPSIDKKGNIYIGSDDNYMYKISDKGIIIWKFKTNSSIQTKVSIDDKGNICFGSLDNYFYILNENGELIYKLKTEGGIISTPTFDDRGNIYFASLDANVYAITKDYKIDWIFSSNYGISSSPVIKDGILYIGSKDGYLYALKIEGSNVPSNYIVKDYFNK